MIINEIFKEENIGKHYKPINMPDLILELTKHENSYKLYLQIIESDFSWELYKDFGEIYPLCDILFTEYEEIKQLKQINKRKDKYYYD